MMIITEFFPVRGLSHLATRRLHWGRLWGAGGNSPSFLYLCLCVDVTCVVLPCYCSQFIKPRLHLIFVSLPRFQKTTLAPSAETLRSVAGLLFIQSTMSGSGQPEIPHKIDQKVGNINPDASSGRAACPASSQVHPKMPHWNNCPGLSPRVRNLRNPPPPPKKKKKSFFPMIMINQWTLAAWWRTCALSPLSFTACRSS